MNTDDVLPIFSRLPFFSTSTNLWVAKDYPKQVLQFFYVPQSQHFPTKTKIVTWVNLWLIYGWSIWLVVDLPLWKVMEWTSVGIMKFPIYGKITNVPNHQPDHLLTWPWHLSAKISKGPAHFFIPCSQHFFRPDPVLNKACWGVNHEIQSFCYMWLPVTENLFGH